MRLLSPCQMLAYSSPQLCPLTKCLLVAMVIVCASFVGQTTTKLWANETEPYVLLTNGNVLRGTAQVAGDMVVLQRGDGSELRIRSTDVAYSAYDLRDVYRYRISRRDYRTPAVIAEDAHWCLRQGLLDEAEAELQKLEQADSGYPLLGRLKRQLSVARNPSNIASQPQPKPSPTTEAENNKPAKHEPPTANISGVSSQSLVDFTARVQPMLIKSCGANGCHRTGGETLYQLSHFGMSTRVSARMTQLNLAATLAFASPDQPEQSPVLQYAMKPHGEDYTAAGRNHLLTQQTLRTWLMSASGYPQPHTFATGIDGATTIASAIPGLPSSQQIAAASGTVPVPQAVHMIGAGPTGAGGALSAGGAAGQPNQIPSLPLPTPATLPQPPGATGAFNGLGTSEQGAMNATADAPPEGFSLDENGEWIYDPDGSFAQERSAASLLQSANKPPQAATTTPAVAPGNFLKASTTPPNPRSPGRPLRLPTVENPVSAERFNRQHQLLTPSSGDK